MPEKIGSDVLGSPKNLRFSGRRPFEYRQRTRDKIMLVLSQDRDKWWNVTPLAKEVGAGFQSVRSILLKLTIKGKVIMDDSDGKGRAYFKFNKEKAEKDLLKLWSGGREVKEHKDDEEDKFALCSFCGVYYNREHYHDGHDCEERRKTLKEV